MRMQKSLYITVLLVVVPVVGTMDQTLLKLGMRKVGQVHLTPFSQLPKTIFQMISVPEVLLAVPLYVAGFLLWLIILTEVGLVLLILSYLFPIFIGFFIIVVTFR